jgi:G3E family GTPase
MSSDSHVPASRATPNAIPLTVIGGFLGAGKTSLVNSVLGQSEGRRLALLVNDFGALSIDAALVSAKSARTVALVNGCVCCTLVNGLAQALLDVLALDPPPDHVLVEASGVSDPRRIAQIARADRSFAEDATVVVAAADQIEALARDRYVGDTVLRQLASADLILLNKRDLVSAEQARRTLVWLRAVSTGSRIIEAVHAELPCDVVLGPAARGLAARARIPLAHAEHAPGLRDADHGRNFTTRTWRSAEPLPEHPLRRALDALPDAVLRVKGFVRFDTAPHSPQLVQAVGRRWTVSPAPEGAAPAESVLVMIGATDALASADLRAVEGAFSTERGEGTVA